MTGKADSRDKLPLHDEAMARAKWRGGETLLRSGKDETGLPASEADDAAASATVEDEDGRPGRGRPGDFPPSD